MLAGGAAGAIARHLSSPPQLVDNLVLIGLHYYGVGPDTLASKPVGSVIAADSGSNG